jgi:hypothetical protein
LTLDVKRRRLPIDTTAGIDLRPERNGSRWTDDAEAIAGDTRHSWIFRVAAAAGPAIEAYKALAIAEHIESGGMPEGI